MIKKSIWILLLCFIALNSNKAFSASTDSCYDTDTVLMLHMDGSDAITTFTDDSASSHSVTANGNAQIDTAQSVFGGASALFDGSGDYLSIADSDDWDFGTGDFTIEIRFRPASLSAQEALIDVGEGQFGTGVYVGYDYNGGSPFLKIRISGSEYLFATTLANNTDYHYVAVRSGTNLYAFLNGTQQGSTATNSTNITSSTAGVRIGQSNASDKDFNGHIDETRVIKGLALWTSNFTVPSSAYTDCNAFRRIFTTTF